MTHDIARGALWMLLLRVVDRSVGIVSTALLARLLVPGDFGLVAMAMSIIAMIELATSFSFDMALIQKPDVERKHYDTAWTLNIIVATCGALATAALAPAAAWFYEDPRIVPVMFAIGAGWLVSGLDNVGTVNFRRNMDFSTEFRLLAAKRLLTFVVTMVAALALRSYWALVVGMVTGRVLGVVLSYAGAALQAAPVAGMRARARIVLGLAAGQQPRRHAADPAAAVRRRPHVRRAGPGHLHGGLRDRADGPHRVGRAAQPGDVPRLLAAGE